MTRFDTVQVYVDLERFTQPVLMGELHCQQSRSGEVFSFNYDEAWLAGVETFAFDPDLALVAGHQYPASDRANFGIFLDSSPIAHLLKKRANPFRQSAFEFVTASNRPAEVGGEGREVAGDREDSSSLLLRSLVFLVKEK